MMVHCRNGRWRIKHFTFHKDTIMDKELFLTYLYSLLHSCLLLDVGSVIKNDMS